MITTATISSHMVQPLASFLIRLFEKSFRDKGFHVVSLISTYSLSIGAKDLV